MHTEFIHITEMRRALLKLSDHTTSLHYFNLSFRNLFLNPLNLIQGIQDDVVICNS